VLWPITGHHEFHLVYPKPVPVRGETEPMRRAA